MKNDCKKKHRNGIPSFHGKGEKQSMYAIKVEIRKGVLSLKLITFFALAEAKSTISGAIGENL